MQATPRLSADNMHLPNHPIIGRLAIALLAALFGMTSVATADDAEFQRTLSAFAQQHCTDCHGGDEPEGELSLDDETLAVMAASADQLETLIDVIDLGEMPPEDASQPEPEEREQIVETLRKQLRHVVEEAERDGQASQTAIRRMNRFQYNNAVIDLFELKCIVFTLPERVMRDQRGYFDPASGRMPDRIAVGSRPLGKSQMIERRLAGVAAFPQDLRAEHGFDNQADHLSLSPLLLESFLSLSRSIVESPDFNQRNVGIWKAFFMAPGNDTDIDQALTNRLRPFLQRAFRSSIDQQTVDRYAAFAGDRIKQGDDFTEAMKQTASAVIASPRFFYLGGDSAPEQDNAVARSYRIANRLSFFLWASIPDEELLSLAAQGELTDPEMVVKQTDRMMLDKRLKRFCDAFPSQWLQIERIISSIPNRKQFSDFYFSKYRSSMHMMLEPLLVFETVLIEDRSILELIDAPFSYRSRRLDQFYYANTNNLPGNAGSVGSIDFHRVPNEDRRYGGVITNAAVMTMTSSPTRTQPITRGAWLATVIFNNPPEPPPADVPPLDEHPKGDLAELSLRKRLKLHRERASCAGCHEKIDPLGFALENFGPTGKWREQDANANPVDMAGTLFGKHDFKTVVEFKDAILNEKDRYARGFTGHLLAYALARPSDASDTLTIDQIVDESATTDYSIKSLFRGVVTSGPFMQ